MLRSNRGNGSDSNEIPASATARKLLFAFHGLMFRTPPVSKLSMGIPVELKVDLRQCVPHRKAKAFLSMVEEMSEVLQIDMVSRKYRQFFTRNYRGLLPPERRLYRVDVLEAGQDNNEDLCVNGITYPLGPQVMQPNANFQECWYKLLNTLRKVQIEIDQRPNAPEKCKFCDPSEIDSEGTCFVRCKFCQVNWLLRLGPILIEFDHKWTDFERTYINKLIDIEKHSRQLLMDCIYTDDILRLYETLYVKVSSGIGVVPQSEEENLNNISSEKVLLKPVSKQQSWCKFPPVNTNSTESNVVENSEPDSTRSLSEDAGTTRASEENLVYQKKEVKSTSPTESQKPRIEREDVTSARVESCSSRNRPVLDKIVCASCAEKARAQERRALDELHAKYWGFAKKQAEAEPADELSRTIKEINSLKLSVKETYRTFFIQLGALNQTANMRRKGKTHFEFEMILIAFSIVNRYYMQLTKQNEYAIESAYFSPDLFSWSMGEIRWVDSLSDSQVISLVPLVHPLLSDFFSLRQSLSLLAQTPERIDPHLAQNDRLVKCLIMLETSWDSVKPYIGDFNMVKSFTGFISFLLDVINADSILNRARSDEVSGTFAEQLASLDVAVLLALPRLIVIFYLFNPIPTDSAGFILIKFLIPSIFGTQDPTNVSISAQEFQELYSKVNNETSGGEKSFFSISSRAGVTLSLNQFFWNMALLSEAKFEQLVPREFKSLLVAGKEISRICDNGSSLSDSDVFMQMLEKAISRHVETPNVEPANAQFERTMNNFMNVLEEMSLKLQRTNPEQWNEFLHLSIKGVQLLRTNCEEHSQACSSQSSLQIYQRNNYSLNGSL